MVLNILLGLLLLLLTGITVLVILWWKKYGKSLFKMIDKLQKTTSQLGGSKKVNDKLDISSLLDNLNNINKIFKK
jgi:hypothetical protein